MNLKTMNKKDFIKRSSIFFLTLFVFSCDNTPTVQSKGIPADLQSQIDKAKDTANTSSENSLSQAKVIYGELVGKWNSVSPIDLKAFKDTKDRFLPAMFNIATTLNSDSSNKSLKDDFTNMYYDSLTQMMRGINNNLQLYQNTFETSRIAGVNDLSNDEVDSLGSIFQATELTVEFISKLAQFKSILDADSTQKILSGVKSQQDTLMKGIVNLNAQSRISNDQKRKLYNAVVSSIYTPSLLPLVSDLAISVFGKDNVAFKQDQLTTSQSDPNTASMVIKEDTSTYRIIRIANNIVNNQIVNDTRGLSASDIQNNTTTVKIK